MRRVTNECQYNELVDFGNGPVLVRCTQPVNGHTNHRVNIELGSGDTMQDVARHNVFED